MSETVKVGRRGYRTWPIKGVSRPLKNGHLQIKGNMGKGPSCAPSPTLPHLRRLLYTLSCPCPCPCPCHTSPSTYPQMTSHIAFGLTIASRLDIASCFVFAFLCIHTHTIYMMPPTPIVSSRPAYKNPSPLSIQCRPCSSLLPD